MQNKKYISLLVAIGISLGLIATSPVFAQTNSSSGKGIGKVERQIKKPIITGTVATINGISFTVTTKAKHKGGVATTYIVDASNATVTKNGVVSTISSIAVGDKVMIQGTLNGTNVVAQTIRDGITKKLPAEPIIQGNGQPIVAGSVTSISGSTITITNKSNVIYTIDASNAKILVKNQTSSISNVIVGDNLIVQGTVNGTSVVASSVIDQKAPANNNTGNSSGDNQKSYKGFMGGVSNFFRNLFGF